ncbi:Josephin-like protein [Hirschfeldia incana]|nr:Josephin-like protein [Hirschfeldia incana]
MSRRGSKRVSFSPPDPEGGKGEPNIYHPTHDGLTSSRHGRRRVVSGGVFSFHVRSSPRARGLLRRIGAGVAKTLRFMSLGRKSSSSNTKSTPYTSSTSSLSLSCSSSSSMYLVKSKSVNESESHRAEAIEDCIEFLHSSSSLSRSNSISAWSC